MIPSPKEGHAMTQQRATPTVPPARDIDPDPLPGPRVTPYFQRAALEEAAARRGLPPEPWAA